MAPPEKTDTPSNGCSGTAGSRSAEEGQGNDPPDSSPVLPRSATKDSPSLGLARAVESIRKSVKESRGVRGFLPAAENAFVSAIDKFTCDLGHLAVENAEKGRRTAVDTPEVLTAEKQVRENSLHGSGGTLKQSFDLALGGLFGGSFVSLGLESVAESHFFEGWYLYSTLVLLLVASGVMFYLGFPRKRG